MTKAKQQQLIGRAVACLNALERKDRDNYLSKLPRGLPGKLVAICRIIDDHLNN